MKHFKLTPAFALSHLKYTLINFGFYCVGEVSLILGLGIIQSRKPKQSLLGENNAHLTCFSISALLSVEN